MAKTGQEAAAEDLERVLSFKEALENAAAVYDHEPAILAAILSRETRGTPATGCAAKLGLPEDLFIGDGGHGHGPMQIDDRSFPDICKAYRDGSATDATMISYGARVLQAKRQALRNAVSSELLEQASVAAYNCGEGNVKRALLHNLDMDHFTTGGDYSKDVVDRAVFFAAHGFGGSDGSEC